VEQLEKLRDDGNFVVSDLQHISPAVAAKMESEWSELSREYTNYAEKVTILLVLLFNGLRRTSYR
jgi:uncharacterized protein YgfB (UPF0149 family)